MSTISKHGTRRRQEDAEDRPVSAEEAAGLRTLSERAVRLCEILRSGSIEDELGDTVAAYVDATAARGISLQRTRDVLELLVHDCAPRHRSTYDLLDTVLRIASESYAASMPRPRRAS